MKSIVAATIAWATFLTVVFFRVRCICVMSAFLTCELIHRVRQRFEPVYASNPLFKTFGAQPITHGGASLDDSQLNPCRAKVIIKPGEHLHSREIHVSGG